MSLESGQAVLVDTNLLVLYVVGSVSRKRIATFKRTSQYRSEDYDLLVQVLANFSSVYTLAHIMAEVSNLTDLHGPDLDAAIACAAREHGCAVLTDDLDLFLSLSGSETEAYSFAHLRAQAGRDPAESWTRAPRRRRRG